ncbi:hypothetical protein V5F59_01555 [Xanthobacter autotrophicus DSM 431]|uniref:hypothetical protein n=1 Tax=Xanthobacter nonsaccharivorans TaxID=3119912 RepID=UPI0037292A34
MKTLFSWAWAKLFPRPQHVETQMDEWKRKAGALLANNANWQLVREVLGRLESAGLRIKSTLDRDLIVTRVIREHRQWCEGDDIARFYAEKKAAVSHNSLDLLTMIELADYSGALIELNDMSGLLSKNQPMSDRALADMIDAHSQSVFENVYTICSVDEHQPGEYVPQHVRELEALACGDFLVQSVTEAAKPGLLVGSVTLSDGRSVTFEISDEKRPDLTPFLLAMNSLVAHLGKGRFVAVETGSSEGFTVLYLRPNEQIAFRNWSVQQRFADGSVPGDWFE